MKYYKLAERPRFVDLKQLGLNSQADGPWVNPFFPWKIGIAAILTGEKRFPKKGEWYLSGAKPEAWRAPNDLTHTHSILQLVLVKTTITTTLLKESI